MAQERLGRYRILGEIASGAQGAVFRGFDPDAGRLVALKVLHPTLTTDRSYLERFHREASLAASIDHPNVVRIFDVGEANGRHFIAMEFLPENLARLIESGGLSVERAASLAAQIADGLGAVHAVGIVHRDMKPQNVLVAPDGTAKVTDFGIARAESLSTMTATGVMMGTPYYMSPEQARGERVDAWSDVYALGCVLYQMLTGEVPFQATTPLAVLRQHIEEQPEPVRRLRSDVPRALVAIVERAMKKDPAKRFANGAEMAKALRQAIPGLPPEAAARRLPSPLSVEKPPVPKRRRRVLTGVIRVLGVVTALIGAATIAVVAVAVAQDRTPGEVLGIPDRPARAAVLASASGVPAAAREIAKAVVDAASSETTIERIGEAVTNGYESTAGMTAAAREIAMAVVDDAPFGTTIERIGEAVTNGYESTAGVPAAVHEIAMAVVDGAPSGAIVERIGEAVTNGFQNTVSRIAAGATAVAEPQLAPSYELRARVVVSFNGPPWLPPEDRQTGTFFLLEGKGPLIPEFVEATFPDGGFLMLSARTNVSSPEVDWVNSFRFTERVPGAAGSGAYVFSGLDANGFPIQDARVTIDRNDFPPPNPPTNVRAHVTGEGIVVAWDNVSAAAGPSEPEHNVPTYTLVVSTANANGSGPDRVYRVRDIPNSSHLIPLSRDLFDSSAFGLPAGEWGEGVYKLTVYAVGADWQDASQAWSGSVSWDEAENLSIVIENGILSVHPTAPAPDYSVTGPQAHRTFVDDPDAFEASASGLGRFTFIDFETLPGGSVPPDGLELDGTEFSVKGVTFEALDPPGYGLQICGPAHWQDGNSLSPGHCPFVDYPDEDDSLVIRFNPPVLAAAFQLVDNDGPEPGNIESVTFLDVFGAVVSATNFLPHSWIGVVSPAVPIAEIRVVESQAGDDVTYDNLLFIPVSQAAPQFNFGTADRFPANGHRYEIVRVDGGVTWEQARKMAASMHFEGVQGHLATITTPEEGRWIRRLGTDDVWIGGIQAIPNAGPESDWHWITGEPWSYTNWDQGEPNDAGLDEYYLMIFPDSEYWNDERPKKPLPAFVVEFPLASPAASPASATPAPTPAPAPSSVWVLRDSFTFDPLRAVDVAPDGSIHIAAGGVVYRSVDGGKNWDWRRSEADCWLRDIQFVSSLKGIAVDDCAKVVETVDGGLTWHRISNDPLSGQGAQAFHFVDSHTGWIAGYNGSLAVTRDGGRTWKQLYVPTRSELTAVYFADENHGWIAGLDRALLSTSDGGATWQRVRTPNDCRIRDIAARLPIMWAVGDCGAVIFSRDGGKTWEDRSMRSDIDFEAVDFVDDQTAWVAGRRYGPDRPVVMETRDGGRTWQRAFLAEEFSGYVSDIVVKVTSAGLTGWAVGDGGLLLELVPRGEAAPATHRPTPAPVPVTAVAAPARGALPARLTWERQREFTFDSLYSVEAVGTDRIYATGDGGAIYRSMDGGASWGAPPSEHGCNVTDIQFLSADVGLALDSCDGFLMRTDDGGASWQQRSSGPFRYGGRTALFFLDTDNGWVAGWGGSLARTRDGGETWERLEVPTTAGLETLYFVDQNHGWAAGLQGAILRTRDGGATWEKANTPRIHCRVTDIEVRFPLIWAVDDCEGVYFSADGGETWQARNTRFDGWFRAVAFWDEQTVWVGGARGGGDWPVILETRDGGRSWREVFRAEDLRGPIEDIVIEETEDGGIVGWAVGEGGLIVRLVPGSGS